MNELVKQIVNDEGCPVLVEDQKWCLSTVLCGDNAVLCTGNFTDSAASSCDEAYYEFKSTKRGGITCSTCLEQIKYIKSVRL